MQRSLGAVLAAAGGAAVPGARAWAQGGAVTPVRAAVSAPGLSFAALYMAKAKDLWQKNSLACELKLVQGGALAVAALTSGEADMACVTSSDPLIAWDKGIRTQVIAAFTSGLAMQMAARSDWMTKTGITPKGSAEAKIKALKGARVGVATIGGGPAQYVKHIATMYGLDGERDMKLLAVGLGAARIAALRENQVDVIVGSAPDADVVALQGFGDLYINFATEVPSFQDFPYTVLIVTTDFAAKNAETTRRIAHTIGQGNDFILANLDEAVAILTKEFPRIDAAAIRRSMERDKPTFPAGGRMTESMWENAVKIAASMKTVKTVPSAKEGELWTNKFLG